MNLSGTACIGAHGGGLGDLRNSNVRKGWSVETLGRRMVYLSLQLGPGAFRVNPQALLIGAYVGGLLYFW